MHADVIIIRSLGTFVTNSTFKIANKLNKPIITEVTGPIFEGNYYGGFFSRMLAVSREWSAKKLNSVAKYTLYVTKNALQERYPNAGIMVGISDVYLPEVDIKKIVEKRSRKNKAEKVVFGTAGSTSLPRKGHKYVIKALGILKREGITNIEYHMAGGGDEADIIKQAKKENVLEMIHFDGTIPALTVNVDKIGVNTACVRLMPDVEYVQILINRKEKKLLLKPCDEIEITGYRWGRTKDGKRYPSQRTGELFVLTLCEIMDWNPDYRYKVLGKMVQANGKALIAFDLTSSECFPKMVNRDGKKVSSRQSVFAEQWSGKFGPTYSESRRSLAVKTFDNYTVITVNGKKTEVHPQAQPQQQGSMGDSL